MKCQILFSGKQKKNYFNISSAKKISPRVLNVKLYFSVFFLLYI